MVARMFACGKWRSGTAWLAVSVLAGLAGCAAQQGRGRPAAAPEAPASQAATAAVDPLILMRQTLARCELLAGYTIVFHRRERRGMLGQLAEWEDIDVQFRKDPRSIRMTWRNPDSEYSQALYVEGSNEGNVTVLPRKGLFGLPPGPVSVPPEMAVTMGKSLRPISDFGLAAMVRQTLSHIDQARSSGGATVRYEGIVVTERLGSRAHHVAISYPKGFTRAARQDLYINVQTGYPEGSYLWLPNGDLLGAYLYEIPVLAVPDQQAFAPLKANRPVQVP
jgi:hypothetical protein